MTTADQAERDVSDKLISLHAILLVARSVIDAMEREGALPDADLAPFAAVASEPEFECEIAATTRS